MTKTKTIYDAGLFAVFTSHDREFGVGMKSRSMSRDEARQLLEHEVVLSPALVRSELERYTFLDPGQAASYFCGYLALTELRTDAERILGPDFDRRAFHDLVLSQGLLPMPLLRKAVVDELTRSATLAGEE